MLYPVEEEKLVGAIVGQCIGDALALGTHWYYDLRERDLMFPRGIHGFEAPLPHRYHADKQAGQQTHYGDGAKLLLQYVATQGTFDIRTFGKLFVDYFGQNDISYRDPATCTTLAHYRLARQAGVSSADYSFQEGADDEHLGTAARLAPLALLYREDPCYEAAVGKLTRLTQNNTRAVAYTTCYARLLAAVLAGQSPQAAILQELSSYQPTAGPLSQEMARALMAALGGAVIPTLPATLCFGQTSLLTSALPAALQATLHHSDSFEEALLAVIRAGGDNAGRASIVGALLGAHLGLEAIPKAWCRRLFEYDQIVAWARQLTAHTLALVK